MTEPKFMPSWSASKNSFIILNWFVGLALLFAVEKFLRKVNNIILAVMPNVDFGEVNQAEVIKIDGLPYPTDQ